MKQTKIVSIIEVLVNVFTGFALAMLIWAFIIPELFPRMAGPVVENFAVTATFTFFSIMRSYLWRRFFNAGFHKTLVNCVAKFWRGENQLKACEEYHLAAALGDRPCTICGEDTWCSKHRTAGGGKV